MTQADATPGPPIRPPSNDAGVWGSAVLFLAIALLIGFDLVDDWQGGSTALHLAGEGVVLLLAAGGVVHLWARFQAERKSAQGLRQRVVEVSAAAEEWRRGTEALLAGLGRAIGTQFSAWKLSEAEAEVALLLLKGLSLREVAAVRETSERTVRQQSLAVYRKAGVAGRAELSAFFLEDLLLPRTPEEVPSKDDGRR